MSLWARYKWANREYYLDDNDVSWLARALWGETGKNGSEEAMTAVAFCMMQRYLRWPGSENKWPFWYQFVRAFSQPVNPAWSDPNGAFARKYPRLCTPARMRRREKIQTCPWQDVPVNAKRIAGAFGAGYFLVSPCPDAVNFGAAGLVKRQKKTGINIGDNVFLGPEMDKGIRWIDGSLEIIL